MKDQNFNSMSVDELWALHEQIAVVLSSKLVEEKALLESKLRMLGTESRDGMRRPYPPVPPKFRNPARPLETWAGRGRLPRWLSDQLRSGKKLDDFRILAT
jgi:DNA-binding protein H-NS